METDINFDSAENFSVTVEFGAGLPNGKMRELTHVCI